MPGPERTRPSVNSREAVRLERLWKAFDDGDVIAVRDVNLTIASGDFVTLLGPSGSGKTTTLMMIAGFVSPSHGEIYIDGRSVTHLPPQRRNLSMVFQSYALFPHMAVGENIAFPLEMRRLPRQEVRQRVARALDMVQLPGYEGRYPHQLSGGQQQRVALARAVVFEPGVLLMDEPLGALDKKLREHMQLELKHIQRRLNITVIYVTHDQEEALTMSDKIAVMREGRIEQVGSPAELYEEPATAFVADFIGESNFIAGVVKDVSDDGLIRMKHRNGRIFCAVHRGPIKSGAKVLAAIRPEHISVTEVRAVDSAQNGQPGRITDAIYIGDSTKYKVSVGDEVLTVKVQNRDVGRRPSVGDEVGLIWQPIHMKLLREQDRAGCE